MAKTEVKKGEQKPETDAERKLREEADKAAANRIKHDNEEFATRWQDLGIAAKKNGNS